MQCWFTQSFTAKPCVLRWAGCVCGRRKMKTRKARFFCIFKTGKLLPALNYMRLQKDESEGNILLHTKFNLLQFIYILSICGNITCTCTSRAVLLLYTKFSLWK